MARSRWPEDVTAEWMPEQEIHESGLLAHINRAVLWPLGLALTVFIEVSDEGKTYEPRLRIQRNQPFDPIAGDTDARETEAQMRRFAEWVADRTLDPRHD